MVFNKSTKPFLLHFLAVDSLPEPEPAAEITGDPLAAEPAVLAGALVGYARVSTKDQRLDRQTLALEAAGCIRIFADKKSGKNVEREELWKALDYMRPGGTLVIPSLDGGLLPNLTPGPK